MFRPCSSIDTASRPNRRFVSWRGHRGVSLVEALVVLAIIAIVAGTAVPLLVAAPARRAFDGVAAALATDLRYARSESVSRNTSVSVSFQASPAGSCYVVHTGTGCTCLPGSSSVAGAGSSAVCESGSVNIKTVHASPSWPVDVRSNVPTMVFNPVNGVTAPAGSVTVSGVDNLAVRHVVSPAGRVRSCIPPGASTRVGTGVKPC